MTFVPTISVASAARKGAKRRAIDNSLVLSYRGADLPGTQREIEEIKAAYGSGVTLLDGEDVGKAEVLDALSGAYDVIHFCGHGEFNYLEPMQSNIHFQNDKGSDGVITAADILRCGSIGHHPIVVLSACTSALVLPNGSNNFLGLAGALIRTGATSIVGARWPISDAVGAAFSKHFHGGLAGGQSVDEAVAFAKNQLRDARIDEWSAFMCIGG
jgi:CHAT domain-containing protein